MTPKLRLGLIAAFAVLIVVAVTGWIRSPSPAMASYAANPEPISPLVTPAAATYDQYGQSPNSAEGGTSGTCDQPAGPLPDYALPRYVRTVRSAPTESSYGDADRSYPEVQPSPQYVETRRVHRRRSTGRSVAIVAGSAGAGAAIGAIAGGGKGAGIGAIAGGAGGFIYDRLTRNR